MIQHTIRLSDNVSSVLTLDAPRGVQTDRYVHSLVTVGEPRTNAILISYDYGKTFKETVSSVVFEIDVDPLSYPEAEMIGFVHRSFLNNPTI